MPFNCDNSDEIFFGDSEKSILFVFEMDSVEYQTGEVSFTLKVTQFFFPLRNHGTAAIDNPLA